jgi:transcriptional regulator with XRE-family HTH domain
MNIGVTINRLRKEQKLSQSELAAAADITQTSLSQIENGLNRPNQKTLDAICKKLGVPEPLLYILSLEPDDVPEEKKMIFDTLYPLIKDMMVKLFAEGDSELKD